MLHSTIYTGLPARQEAETWAGGNMSWNTGVNYAHLFARSSMAALEKRVDTGRWPDTGPNALNASAARLDPGAPHAYRTYQPAPYPRPFDLAR